MDCSLVKNRTVIIPHSGSGSRDGAEVEAWRDLLSSPRERKLLAGHASSFSAQNGCGHPWSGTE